MKSRTNLVLLAVVAVLLGVGVAPRAEAGVISIDFSVSTTMASTATAGVVRVGCWNKETGTSGTLLNLTNDTGAATTVNGSWNFGSGGGVYDFGGYSTTADDASMMNSAGYTRSSSFVTFLTVSNVPSSPYNVYVYINQSGGGEGRTGNFRIGGQTIGWQEMGVTKPALPAGYDPAVSTSDTGNYVVFSNLSGSSFALEVQGLTAGLYQAGIAGVQIQYTVSAIPTNSTYRMPITFTNDARLNTLTNFPALVVLDTSKVNYSQFLANGQDLRFLDASGSELNYEVESWMEAGGASNSYIWVQVPTMTAGCSITAYWGNASATFPSYRTNGAVWDAGSFRSVWHMMQTNTLDSTTNANNGTGKNGIALSAAGLAGPALSLDGSDDYVDLGTGMSLGTADASLSIWFKTTVAGGAFIGKSSARIQAGRYVLASDTGPVIQPIFDYGTGGQVAPTSWTGFSDGKWHNVVGTFSRSGNQTLYLDGVYKNASSISAGNGMNLTSSDPFYIGAYGNSSGSGPLAGLYFNGLMDEGRLYRTALSSNWVWASYANMASNSAFNTYGAVGSTAGGTTTYKLPMAFTNYTQAEVLTNFPVLVVFSNGLYGTFDYSKFTSPTNGGDLRFWDSTETTNLDFEIESWNTNGASCAWVRVPLLSSNTTIYAKWGTSDTTLPACTTNGAVWDANFKGVYHLKETGTNPTVMDSTANRSNSTAQTWTPTNSGVVGAGAYFDGTQSATLYPAVSRDGWTMECWAKDNTSAGSSACLGLGNSASIPDGAIIPNRSSKFGSYQSDVYRDSTIATVVGVWKHLALTRVSATVGKLYVDGVEYAANPTSTSSDTMAFYLAAWLGGGSKWKGTLDEARISNVARSSNWVWACYATMASNAFFNGYGTVVTVSGGSGTPPGIQNRTVSGVTTGGATFNGTLTSTGSAACAVGVYWGTDTNAWANTNWFNGGVTNGTWTNSTPFSTNITLSGNLNYYYTYVASNAVSNVVATAPQYLITGEVTVEATDATAKYPGNTGVFTIRRPSDLTNSLLTVNYTMGGTAISNVDYTALSGSVTLGAGISNIAVTVTPVRVWNPDREAILTLAPGAYAVGTSGNAATVTVLTASTIYVATNGTHDVANNFDTWAGAATNMNAAVSLANTLALPVLVSNGTYRLTNELLVATNISVQSVGGPGVTTLYRDPGYTNRILTVTNANALVAGFTLTNGLLTASAAGMCVKLDSGVVSNCVVAQHSRGSGWGSGGIVNIAGGRMTSCVISNNYGWYGMFPVSGSGILEDTVITACAVDDYGAIQVSGSAIMRRCRIYKNNGNRPEIAVSGGAVENCLIYSNSASGSYVGSSPGIAMTGGRVVNCTIANNKSSNAGAAGVYRTSGGLTNCIIYGNKNGTPGENYNGDISACAYSCAPELTNSAQYNTALNPRYVNAAAADYRLEAGSPCLDTGTNLTGVTTDIDGVTRPLAADSSGTLRYDMGVYEKNGALGALAIGFSGTPLSGMNSVTSVFTAAVSGTNTTISWWGWDFNSDGTYDTNGTGLAVVTNAFGPGRYTVSVRVTNSVGETAAATNANYVLVVGTDIFVATNGGNVLPYSTWATAATNLNDAVDIALAGCTVHLSNGSHRVTKKMNLFTGFTVKGEYGRDVTTVWRDAGAGKFGLFDMRHANAAVSGLTMTNGLASGVAGSAINMTAGTVSNCVITRCSKPSDDGGGGIVYASGGLITGCVVSNNSAWYGVVSLAGTVSVEDSLVCACDTHDYGVVMLQSDNAAVRRCQIVRNVSGSPGNGAAGVYHTGGRLENCLIYTNSAVSSGYAGGVYLHNPGSVMVNCTVAGNVKGSGTGSGVVRNNGAVTNCIMYGNGAGAPADNYSGSASACWYSDAPSPDLTAGSQGNINDNPSFVGASTGNYRLAVGSLCIDAGTNVWTVSDLDLDRVSRKQGSRVDIGAYEYDPTAVPFSVAFNVAPAVGIGAVTGVMTATTAGGDTNVSWWGWDFNNDGTYETNGTGLRVVTNVFGLGRHSVSVAATNSSGNFAASTNLNCVLVVAQDIYVTTNGGNVLPYASWVNAATSFNDAVDIAQPGCTVHVSNGNHRLTKKVDLFTGFTVVSENGPEYTTAYRDTNVTVFGMFDLRHANAMLSGFTITNGGTNAASVFNMTAGTVSNCVIRKNDSQYTTGGMLALSGGRVTRCVVTNNNAFYVLASVSGTAVIEDSLVANNTCGQYGLIQLSGSAVIRRTRIEKNTASYHTAGVQMSGGTLENCLVYTNVSTSTGGADGSGGVLVSGGAMVNCTVVGNRKTGSSTSTAGGVLRTSGGALTNCIVYGNAGGQTNNYAGPASAAWNSCAPELTHGSQGNITNDPVFVSVATNDYSLQMSSPCVDTGSNIAGLTLDLVGASRTQDGNGDDVVTMDMGAYERRTGYRGATFRLR